MKGDFLMTSKRITARARARIVLVARAAVAAAFLAGAPVARAAVAAAFLAGAPVARAAASATATAGVPGDTLRIGVDQAVAMALRDGAEAAMARLDVEAAEAQVGVALSYALPQVSLAGTYTRNLKKPVIFFEFEPGVTQTFEIGEDNAWFGTLALNQTIWASGRVSSGYKMAKRRAQGARLVGDDAAAAIARDVKTAYYAAKLAAEQVGIAERSLEQAKRNVSNIEARVERGVAPEFDALRARVTVASRRPLATRARNGRTLAADALKRLIGVPLDRPISLIDPLGGALVGAGAGEWGPPDADRAVRAALSNRRDLAGARREAEAAEFQYRAQKANSRPLLSLGGNVSWQGETSKGLWPGDREKAASAAVGLSLSWPLMDGFRTRNQARVAGAMAEKARTQVRRIEELVELEVRSHCSDVESIAKEIDASRQTVDVARKAYDIARVRYEQGLSTLVEMLDIELAAIGAELNLSETLYRYDAAVATLEYSMGNGPALSGGNGE